MKKTITIGDRLNPLVRYVLAADIAKGRFIKQPADIGEENLICEQKIELVAKNGKERIGQMKAFVWFLPSTILVPESDARLAASARQQAINHLIGLMKENQEIESKNLKYDNTHLIGEITVHIHIVELYVKQEYRNRGIASNMLDFIQALTEATTISFYSTRFTMYHTVTGYALSRLGFREAMTTIPSLHNPAAKKTLYIHSIGTVCSLNVIRKPEQKKPKAKKQTQRKNKTL